ncbi:MAG TPA: LuxR C-terminal-related transcriptional regulator [Thermoleophilaceae bacterium]
MPTTDADALLRQGWEALRAADWQTARSCFEQALDEAESAEALDGLSQAVHFLREYDRATELKERAFAAYRQAGDPVKAADTARWLAFLHGTYAGNYAAASGWMGRAKSMLDAVPECAGHGWLVLDSAVFSDGAADREKCAVSALAIARRFGDTDLEFGALALLGECRVATGRVAEGMRLLDEAMAAATGGEVSSHGTVGEICCRLLSACEHATDVRRAEQWMDVVLRTAAWTDFVVPTCRTHYGGILVALGRWEEAETELRDALETFRRGYRGDGSFPLIRLAELRVRQGRYEEAERLLEEVDWHPTARRAMASIALGRGDLALAEELAQLCMDGADPADPKCAPLLALLVEIQLGRDQPKAAGETLARLRAMSEATSDELAAALTHLANGRLAAATGDDRAAADLTKALESLSALNLPLEAARARLALARTLTARSADAAAAEARLSLRAFERLGAARDADAAAALLRDLGERGRARRGSHGPLTPRETEVLGLLASGLSNADIAARLVISRRTAEHHVASVMSKLGLRSRAEAAAYALRAPEDT